MKVVNRRVGRVIEAHQIGDLCWSVSMTRPLDFGDANMNSNDEYQAWLNTRRGESPPTGLTDRIMLSVRELPLEATTSPQLESARKTAWQRAIPYLVCSAAALMLAVRLFSMVSLFVVPSSIADVTMIEPAKEDSHEP